LECGENRRFGIFSCFFGDREKKKNTKAAILAALQMGVEPLLMPSHELIVRLNGVQAAFSPSGRLRSHQPRVSTSVSVFVFTDGRRVLDTLLDAGWTVTHGDGTINTKAEYLADLKSGARKFFADVKQDDFAVRVYGDTAVAAGISDSKVEYKGKPSGGALRFTRVYVKRDGRWVMITSHATRR